VLQKVASSAGTLYTGGAKDFIYCVVGAVLLLGLDFQSRGHHFEAYVSRQALPRRWAMYLFLSGCILTMGVFDASQFIYFQF
jgi:alginate O-acetyltransferase complex protein AlgI